MTAREIADRLIAMARALPEEERRRVLGSLVRCRRGLHWMSETRMANDGCRECSNAADRERYAKNAVAVKLRRCGVE